MKERPLTLASIGAAIVASLCCIGPLVAVFLGLGTFGAAAFFEQFRPYFLGVTALLLAGAWYLAYRKNAACNDGLCPSQSPVRHTRLLVSRSTAEAWCGAFCCLSLLFPAGLEGGGWIARATPHAAHGKHAVICDAA